MQRTGERQTGGRSPLARAAHQANAGAQLRSPEDARNVLEGNASLVLKVRVRRRQVFQRTVDLHPCGAGGDDSRVHRDTVLLHGHRQVHRKGFRAVIVVA